MDGWMDAPLIHGKKSWRIRKYTKSFSSLKFDFFPVLTYPQESIAWLEQFLDRYRETIVCIVCTTHDRYFLNSIAGWILELTNELEWIRTNPKAKGNKSRVRLSRYDELLVAAAPKEMRNAEQIIDC
jgi:hypothetical protein